MTLALILLVGNLFAPTLRLDSLLAAGLALPQAPQSSPADQPPSQDQKPPTPDSNHQAPAQPPPETKPAPPPSAQKVSAKKHVARKKKNADCTPASAGGSSTDAAAGGAPADASSSAAKAPESCPPPMVVVDQGSTKEPTIQLVGGPAGAQAANQRNTANEKLATTEANLKKTADWQLNANQQDMISQIRQFMEQSRKALQAGDSERASTLAGKAQQLSEELVKPEKQ